MYGCKKISDHDLELRTKARTEQKAPPFEKDNYWINHATDVDPFEYKYTASDFDRFGVWYTFSQDAEKTVRNQFIMHKLIKPGQTMLDAGAYCGAWAIPCAKMGASVIAFEVDPRYYKEFLLNIEINDLSDSIAPINQGLYSENIKSDWYDLQQAEFGKLDDYLSIFNVNGLEFAKVDVEGAELELLKGGINTFKKYKPNMFIECHLEWDKDIVSKVNDFLLKEIDPNYLTLLFPLTQLSYYLLVTKPTVENKLDRLSYPIKAINSY